MIMIIFSIVDFIVVIGKQACHVITVYNVIANTIKCWDLGLHHCNLILFIQTDYLFIKTTKVIAFRAV